MTSYVDDDFYNLKYNLYEILNVDENAENSIIKKNYIKLIKNYHPDRNSEIEEDIYQHIIIANQILLNNNLRIKYNEYIHNKNNNFIELKNDFIKNSDKTNMNGDTFEVKLQELNKIHGYNEDINKESTIDKFIKFKSTRNKDIIIKNNDDLKKNNFNDHFINYKLNNNSLIDHILEYNDNPVELSTHVIGENYINLYDLNKLYIEDSVTSSNFSSLDRAFTLQPENMSQNKNFNLSIEDKLKLYKEDTLKINIKNSQ